MIDGRRIKPISYLKSHAAEVLKDLKETGKPYVITQHGEGRAVLLDIDQYENMQETAAMLQIVSLGRQQISEGKARPAEEVFADLRKQFVDKA